MELAAAEAGEDKGIHKHEVEARRSHWRQDPPLLLSSSSFLLELTLLYNK